MNRLELLQCIQDYLDFNVPQSELLKQLRLLSKESAYYVIKYKQRSLFSECDRAVSLHIPARQIATLHSHILRLEKLARDFM